MNARIDNSRRRLPLFAMVAFLVIAAKCTHADDRRICAQFTKVQGGTVLQWNFHCNSVPSSILDTNNLRLWEGTPSSYLWYSETEEQDLRVLLLGEGWATLVDESKATQAERDAQGSAREGHSGVWGSPSPTQTQPQPDAQPQPQPQPEAQSPVFDRIWNILASVIGVFWKVAVALATFGILQAFVRHIYFNRRVRLLIVGAKGVGKTALNRRILEPTKRRDLLHLSPSTGVVVEKGKDTYLSYKKYEIRPEVHDTAGSHPGEIFDKLTESYDALIVVVAPNRDNGLDQQEIPIRRKLETDPDMSFINEQLGWANGLIGGAIAGRSGGHFKCIMFYISKCDQYCDHRPDPDDSRDRTFTEGMKAIFAAHIDAISKQAKYRSIHFDVAVGSPEKNWNTKEVGVSVVDLLYGGKS